MTKEELFEIWAPRGGRWSPWVKPVLFAFIETAPPLAASQYFLADSLPEKLLVGIPASDQKAALVIELPGELSVELALKLAARGYRPVPLFNAVPAPTPKFYEFSYQSDKSIVDVQSILNSLQLAAGKLSACDLSPEAPPAFLLDSNRSGFGKLISPGSFDNRSVSFSTDFPSATFLQTQGITRIVLIQLEHNLPQADISHTLRAWQEGGLVISVIRLKLGEFPAPIKIERPSAFGLLWQRALSVLGLRRHGLGGFGGTVPTPSAG